MPKEEGAIRMALRIGATLGAGPSVAKPFTARRQERLDKKEGGGARTSRAGGAIGAEVQPPIGEKKGEVFRKDAARGTRETRSTRDFS
jgi:hypothetical protein